MAVQRVPEDSVSRYGIVVGEARQDGLIDVTDVVEKPDPGAVRSRMAVAARYVVGPAVLAELRDTPPDASGEVQLADAFTALLARGERMVGVPLLEGERRRNRHWQCALVQLHLPALRAPRSAFRR